jgi:Family of unknown function (DUF5681)
MDAVDPSSGPPAEANAAPPAQPAASFPLAPEQSAGACGTSAFAQDGQPEIAGSRSLAPGVDAELAQLSGSPADQRQQSAAQQSGESALAQDGQSSDASQSVPPGVGAKSAQSSGSAADQAQQSAAMASGSPAPAPAEPPKVATGLPALVHKQLPAAIEVNSPKLPGRPFQPGQSGNPLGRPKGSHNRITQLTKALIDGEAEEIVAKAVQKVREGDRVMIREMLNRVAPRSRDRLIEFELPKIVTASDARAASTALFAALSRGEISPSEATQVMGLLKSHVRLVDSADLEPRVTALEEERKK